jgi:hypothetical protein
MQATGALVVGSDVMQLAMQSHGQFKTGPVSEGKHSYLGCSREKVAGKFL